MKITVETTICVCDVCEHNWSPKTYEPVKCPRCQSTKWNSGRAGKPDMEKLSRNFTANEGVIKEVQYNEPEIVYDEDFGA